jgi:hypothetical protein
MIAKKPAKCLDKKLAFCTTLIRTYVLQCKSQSNQRLAIAITVIHIALPVARAVTDRQTAGLLVFYEAAIQSISARTAPLIQPEGESAGSDVHDPKNTKPNDDGSNPMPTLCDTHDDQTNQLHSLQNVRDSLTRTALHLMEALDEESIAAAPLNQRATALGIVLDRLLKVEQQLPTPPTEPQEYVYRVEYKDPDGSLHPTPSWARKHLERDDAL